MALVAICDGAACGECYRCRLAMLDAAYHSTRGRLEELHESHQRLIGLARELRARQRAFFRGHGREALEAAKAAEREIDEYLERCEQPLFAEAEEIEA